MAFYNGLFKSEINLKLIEYTDAKGVGIDHDFMTVITFSIIRALNGLMIQILKMRNCDDFLIFVHQRKIKKRVS